VDASSHLERQDESWAQEGVQSVWRVLPPVLFAAAVSDGTGSLARVGPNELVTCDPGILRRVWGVRSQYRRGAIYDAVRLDPSWGNVISLRDDATHT